MSRHHRRLLRRLRAAWVVPGQRPHLARDPWLHGGRWRVVADGIAYTVDRRRCTALHLALLLTRSVRGKLRAEGQIP